MSEATQQTPADEPQHSTPRLTSQSIRSFVLRQGRMSDAQHRFLDEMMRVLFLLI